MRRVQKFIGVADAKPASAPLPSPSSTARHANTGESGSSGSLSYDSQHANTATAGSNLQVPAGTPGIYQNQPTAPSGSVQSPSSMRGSNPPSPSMHNRASVAQPPYGDYFAAARTSGATSPVPSAGPMQTPRPITPVLPSGAPSPGLGPTMPTWAQSATAGEALAIERADLHKTLKALEGLLVNLDEYRDLAARMAKAEKKLARSASELAKVKSVQRAPSATLAVASTMFDSLNEVSSKHAKLVQREYESLNESCAKYFKKVAKEERAHEELVDSLDAKIKKANAAHEKNAKKASSSKALESHDKYIATVQALTADISRARQAHWRSMAVKSHSASLVAASTLGGLADVDFRTRCETVRRVGPHVGKLNEWLSFTSSEAMPALQPADLDENEVLHAQFLANAEAQMQAYADAQAEAQARMQEEAQTAIRAQQMGWRPPSAASQRPEEPTATTLANLPKLDESGRLIEQTPAAAHADETQPSSDRASVRNVGSARDGDAASVRSQAASIQPSQARATPAPAASNSDRPSREHLAEMQPIESKPVAEAEAAATTTASTPPQDTLNVAAKGSSNSGVRLDRAPTGSTMKSMAVQAESWEHSSLAGEDQGQGQGESGGEGEGEKGHDGAEHQHLEQQHQADGDDESSRSVHGRKDSSTAEGTVVDRLSAPTDGSDATMPSLSRSGSAKGSEDGVRAPRTPLDGEDLRSSTAVGVAESDRRRDGADEGQRRDTASPSKTRPAERALDRYKTLGHDADSTPRYPSDLRRVDEPMAYDQDPGAGQDEYSRARKISLWERERERMRQLERETELQMRLREEQLVRSEPPYAAYASTGPAAGSGPSSSFSSRPTSSLYGGGRALPFAVGESAEAYGRGPNGGPGGMSSEPYDPDRYAPAVGRSRLSGVSVSRTLSTDTTASERSFVARMKARYQEEKELERSQRELNALEREKAARRMALPPNTDLSVAGSRRVSEMASRYMGSDSMSYGGGSVSSGRQQAPPLSSRTYDASMPMRRYHDSLPSSSSLGGARNLASPQPAHPQPSEFGSYRDPAPRGNRPSLPPQPSQSPIDNEPPHSDVCGCQRCSVRHYGSGGGTGAASSQQQQQQQQQQQRPPPSRSAGQDPREFNQRRQSMPVRAQGDLRPPQYGSAGEYARQSYEDLRGGQERKVAFAHTPQTIR
ncbi:uncharacterized protein PFL1_02007 [Pseudozyma flocculosa PF-1]|uniref:Uncharacterized protein n=1 Tax=Pseudozyma flocculosa TaxID=84751 RepID=A0A5C3F0F0_9BASI|nr:uncharacterized protein PFL1_02007 [Pseudozyma flocculosa PF-1]EPQ30481.1 hypothetical protein PFL1_02007 [Pseudozyma flocculosa PF-1]SPO37565.1 uncharacterized protein PSFLO_03040 [Pseudozyma flocculosa]